MIEFQYKLRLKNKLKVKNLLFSSCFDILSKSLNAQTFIKSLNVLTSVKQHFKSNMF